MPVRIVSPFACKFMDTFRAGELVDAMKAGSALVVERHERITGYATVTGLFSGTPLLKLTSTSRH